MFITPNQSIYFSLLRIYQRKYSILYILIKDTILKGSILLIEGYFVIDKHDIIPYLIKEFSEKNKTIAFTLSSTSMIKNYYDKLIYVANYSHLIFCSKEEAECFAGVSSDNNDMDEIALKIHRKLKSLERILIITNGKNPTHISKYRYMFNEFDYVLYSYADSVDVNDIIDTNGCGDGILYYYINIAFCGGFLSQYIQGKQLVECARAV